MTLRVCQETSFRFEFVVNVLHACGSQAGEAKAPWAFEHFVDQGVEFIEVDRVSQQRNIGDQRSLADLYGRLSRQ